MSKPACEPSPQGQEVIWLDDTESGRSAPSRETVLSIGNVARMFGVSRLMLRYFEFRGLIRRGHVMDGQRVYGWADCERIAFIVKCRRAGVPLNDLTGIIAATEEDATSSAFKQGQEQCMALVDRLERKRKTLDAALSELSHVYALLTGRLFNRNGANHGC
ncbi:MAG: MerR family transcriptional regulator [Alphaproteobacteria bacterium]|nr:MerR family transcriptional regulator [Alphaproteobacteria bacterium]